MTHRNQYKTSIDRYCKILHALTPAFLFFYVAFFTKKI